MKFSGQTKVVIKSFYKQKFIIFRDFWSEISGRKKISVTEMTGKIAD